MSAGRYSKYAAMRAVHLEYRVRLDDAGGADMDRLEKFNCEYKEVL